MKPLQPGKAFTQISWDPQVSAYLEAALGPEKFKQIQAAIAVPPLSTCLRVNTLKTSTEEVLRQLQDALPAGSTHIAPHPQLPVAVLLQGSGPNVLDAAASGVTKEVVISRKAGEAVLRGAQVFVPGVLAVSAGLAAGDSVAVTVALGVPGSSHSGITRGTILPAADSSGSSNSGCSTTAAAAADPPPQGSAVSTAVEADVEAGTTAADPADAADDAGLEADGQAATVTATATAAPPAGAAGGRLCIGIGRAQMSRVEMFRVPHGVAVVMERRVYDVPSPPLEGDLKGSVMLQNLPSIVAAQVLNPTPGSRVLDMCAAPGGKTTMLAQIMQGKGEVIALDRSHAKVDDIKALAAELGCSSCIQAYKMDSTKAVAASMKGQHPVAPQQQQDSNGVEQQQTLQQQVQQPQHVQTHQQEQLQQHQQQQHNVVQADRQCQQQQAAANQVDQQEQEQQQQQAPFDASGLSAKSLARLQRRIAAMAVRGQEPTAAEYRLYGMIPAKCPGFAPESFDCILLDAPCTALGLRPRLLQQHTLGLLLDTAAYQRGLMAAAVQLLKVGGALVYSTCTINPAENEINVRHLLDSYPCLQLVPAEPRLGGPGLMGPHDRQAMAAAVAAAAAAAAAAVSSKHPTSKVATGSSGGAAAGPGDDGSGSVGVPRWEQFCSGQWLSEAEAGMVQRFDPAGPADTIGFFVAKFIKTCSCL